MTSEFLRKELVSYLQETIKNVEIVKSYEKTINEMSFDELKEYKDRLIPKNRNLVKRRYLKKLSNRYLQAYQIGNFSKSIEIATKAYKYSLKHFGREDKGTITSMINLALLYESQGRYSEAEPIYKQCLQLRKKILGTKHPDTLTSINNLAYIYEAQGRYSEAEPFYKQCLQLRKKILGAKHPDTLTSINNLASIYKSQGRYSEAEPLYKRCLQLSEKNFGSKHPDMIPIINNLAELYKAQGRYIEAESLYKQCLQISEEVLGPKHSKTIIIINNFADLYSIQSRYSEAELLFKKCLQLSEEVLEKNHPDTISININLAGLYYLQGRYTKAEAIYKRYLELSEEILGPKHNDTLVCKNNLALLYVAQGKYPEAEPLYKRCLQLRKKFLGENHPDTLISINNLACLYFSQGRYAEAEQLFKRCLQLSEKVLGKKHPETLARINNLASLYQAQDRYTEAERFRKRCFQMCEKELGVKHKNTLLSINNLADVYFSKGRYNEAEPLYKRCLQLREELLGENHPDTLISINNLACLYFSQGRYAEAEQLFKRCLQLCEKVLGKKHPETLKIMLSYTNLLILLNLEKKALKHLKTIEHYLLRYTAYTLQSSQNFRVRRHFMSNLSFQDVLFSFAFQSKNPDIINFACDVVLRWKCVQEEAETTMNRILHFSQNPRIIQLGQSINDLRHQMNIFDKHSVDINALIQQLEQKELQLASLSNAYQHYLKKASIQMRDLQLPSDVVIIELKQFKCVNFNKGQSEDIHLAAALIRPNSHSIILEDLGLMKDIVLIFESMRTAKNQKTRKSASKELYARLFGVFDKHIQHATTIYISPEGMTHNIAFARLILPDGRFWIERQNICRIQTSRDLLDSTKPINNGTLVAMGGIDYNQFPSSQLKLNTQAPEKHAINRSIKRTSEMIESFNSLPFSTIEVESIKIFYQLSQKKTPLIFRGTSASEYQIKHLKEPPNILHLSTHGFYLYSSADITERPMLLSGIALAGSNLGLKGKKGPSNEDGILHAIEVAGLDLTGTELVVLSACDTGKGTIDKSEGVYGLLRAFRLAGAHDIMMTLWSIQDQSASNFLISFYKTWLSNSNITPLKALRQTQLSFIQKNKDSSLWAPYVMVVGNVK